MLLKWRELNPKIGNFTVLSALGVLALAVYFLHESEFELLSPAAILERGDAPWLGGGMAVLAVAFLGRAGRWRFLLPRQTSTAEALSINGVFYAANLFLPFRLGEGVRPLLMAKRGRGGVFHGIGLVVWERIFDLAFSTSILAIGLLSPIASKRGKVSLGELSVDTSLIHDGFVVLCAAAGMGLVSLPLLLSFRPLVARFQERSSSRWAGILGRMLEELSGSLRFLKDSKSLLGLLGVTTIYWCLVVLALGMIAKGCHFDPSVSQSCLLSGLLIFGLLLPAPPAQLGLHQAISLMALLACFPVESVRVHGSLFAGAYYLINLCVACSGGLFGYLWLMRHPVEQVVRVEQGHFNSGSGSQAPVRRN